MEDSLENAIDDFIRGNGKGIPSEHTCDILVNNFKPINNLIKKSLEKKLKKISIMPYGDSLQCWENPVYVGNLSRSIHILDENGNSNMEVIFDRN